MQSSPYELSGVKENVEVIRDMWVAIKYIQTKGTK